MLIDKQSPTPLYHQLKEIIIEKIQSGECNPKEPIPSERELQDMFGLSRDTVRRAIRELIKDHLLYIDRGHGTFVREAKVRRSPDGLGGFSIDMHASGILPGQRIVSLEKVLPPPQVVIALDIPKDIEVQKVVRLRLANGREVGLQTAYLPGVDITKDELEESGALYKLLKLKTAEALLVSLVANIASVVLGLLL